MAELKPGEFLITREQHRQLMLDILSGRKRIQNEVLAPTVTDPHAFDPRCPGCGEKNPAHCHCGDIDAGPVDCRGEPLELGPATRADLAEFDAVPEPVDSDAPREVFVPDVASAVIRALGRRRDA